jgi:hypothetical protein
MEHPTTSEQSRIITPSLHKIEMQEPTHGCVTMKIQNRHLTPGSAMIVSKMHRAIPVVFITRK